VRYQLAGFDFGWIDADRDRRASYVRLPPGSYTLRVSAANQDGRWTEPGASLAVTVVPAWWQRWWFAAALVAGFTGGVVWLVRFWSHRRLKRRLHQLQREHALEKERARIARDLHDELGGSLTQIRMLADRLRRHAPNAEAQTVAAQLSTRTRRLTGELESIVWTVSPKNNTWDRLAAFIGQYALRFFRDTPLACTVHGIDSIPALPLRPDEQHHVLAVAKEALNNTLKHASATRVTVTMAAADGVFSLEIRDNGTGFDAHDSALPARNGLTNMRARAREIGARLELETAPGAGTRIALHLPLVSPPNPAAS
jgi:signal transduction histidine kinase